MHAFLFILFSPIIYLFIICLFIYFWFRKGFTLLVIPGLTSDKVNFFSAICENVINMQFAKFTEPWFFLP